MVGDVFMVEEKIGMVEHFFTNVSVAAIKITNGELKIGDTIHIVGVHTDFKQKIDSMQIDRVPVTSVKKSRTPVVTAV